jgi:hypothetical protein
MFVRSARAPIQQVATLKGLAGKIDLLDLVCPNHRYPPDSGDPSKRDRFIKFDAYVTEYITSLQNVKYV